MYQQPSQPEPNTDPPAPDWPTAPPLDAAWPAPAPPELPPADRRPVRVTVAAAIAALLLLVLIANGATILGFRSQLGADTSTLDKKLTAHRLAQQQAREELQARFRQADLPGKLRTVRTRDAAATAALIAWGSSGQPGSGLTTIRQARDACADAVIDYNATAARFPYDVMTGLPLRINASDAATDCDR